MENNLSRRSSLSLSISSDTEDENDQSIVRSNATTSSNESKAQRLNNSRITECKELIQFRPDNVAYFISSENQPCDEGAQKFYENKKGKTELDLDVGEVQRIARNNHKSYFALCIKGQVSESIKVTQENLCKCLDTLRTILQESEQFEISFAKSNHIENVSWEEVLKLIKNAFKDTEIKVIICNGSLKYVPYEKRDEIFHELHKSPIGGHKGVSKTYNRIK